MFSTKNPKYELYFVIGLFLVIFTFNCAEKKPPTWGTEETGFILSYRPDIGDVFVYDRTMESSNQFERSGQSFESTSQQKYVFQLETEKIDSLVNFILTVDTLGFSTESARGSQTINFGDIKGKRSHVSITPKGEGREITLLDSLPTPEMDGRPIPGEAKNWLAASLFKIPGKPIKIGDSWTETKLDTSTRTDTTRQTSRTSINDRETKYAVLAKETRMGFECLHFKLDSKYSIESSGTVRGNETSSEGEGETTSHVWFAFKEGILVEYTADNFYEGTMAFSGERGSTSANSTESKSCLKLVKWQPQKKQKQKQLQEQRHQEVLDLGKY